MPSWLAVILSVTLVLFFGEIFPSAVFTGKNQLAIAAAMSWFVYALMMVLGAVAWPIAWSLVRIRNQGGGGRMSRGIFQAVVVWYYCALFLFCLIGAQQQVISMRCFVLI